MLKIPSEIITDKYCLFWGSGSLFNNWEYQPILWDNIKFQNSELVFMYEKAKLFKDAEIIEDILEVNQTFSNWEAQSASKVLGRMIKNFDSWVWDSVKKDLMIQILIEKVKQNPNVKEELMKYKHLEFVEASPYDSIWGIGLQPNDIKAQDSQNWKGLNLLGECWDIVQRYFESLEI